MTDLGVDLDALVSQMVKDASKEGVSLEERAKVFKMASQHHLNMVKVRGSSKPDNTKRGGPNMSDLRDRLDDSGTTQQKPEGDEDDDEQA